MSTLSLLLLMTCLCETADAFTLSSKRSLTRTSYTPVPPLLQVRAQVVSSTAVASAIATTSTITSKKETKSDSAPFENFDYNAHWYPVIWAHDLRLNEPTKVTVFDVDYVIAKTSETEVVGLLDVCPHKAAALSQGRMTASGHFQCAYHGWSFDGTSGDCMEIPQLVQAAADGDDSTTSSSVKKPFPKLSQRTGATAVPTMIHQQMVWLFPGGNLEQALLAPPPPSVPEVASGQLKMSTAIRDIPVDWPILVSNICDPDHGVFAHQAKPFDWYTASVEEPLQLVQEFPDSGKGFIMKSKVPAKDKVLSVDRKIRGTHQEFEKKQLKKQQKQKTKAPTLLATSFLQLPTHLQLKRVNAETNTTNFISTFYICPVGVGRSRFMSAGISTMAPKRWLTKLLLDNFLDQDTYLLASQEHTLLAKEADELKRIMKQKDPEDVDFDITKHKLSVRRNLFALQSPSEKMGSKIEQFWDATLTRVPNRVENLLKLDQAGALLHQKTREQVLDRASQHLAISPDAQDVVKNCHKLVQGAKAISILTLGTKLVSIWLLPKYSWASRIPHAGLFFLKPTCVAAVVALSSAVSYLASKMIREYYYKYTDDYRRKDLSKIPTLWMDK